MSIKDEKGFDFQAEGQPSGKALSNTKDPN